MAQRPLNTPLLMAFFSLQIQWIWNFANYTAEYVISMLTFFLKRFCLIKKIDKFCFFITSWKLKPLSTTPFSNSYYTKFISIEKGFLTKVCNCSLKRGQVAIGDLARVGFYRVSFFFSTVAIVLSQWKLGSLTKRIRSQSEVFNISSTYCLFVKCRKDNQKSTNYPTNKLIVSLQYRYVFSSEILHFLEKTKEHDRAEE